MIRALLCAGTALAALAAAGCAHLQGYYNLPASPTPSAGYTATPVPATPTPMPSGSAAPLVCATPDINDLNVVYVAMSADMTPSTDAQGHSIFGYATYADAVNEGYPPQTSAVVNVAMGELVQFINMEPLGSTIAHSAVGFTSSFPTVPYSFPSGSDQQVGDVLTNVAASNAVPWSTAEIEPPDDSTIDSYCASQVFQAGSTGTFYFGDYDTYNSSASMRGEIVVGAGSSTLAKHRFLTTR